MEEYEHSFKVKFLEPFIKFCEENNFKQISATSQNRKVYESIYNSHLISRLTIEKDKNETKTYFDFKFAGVEIDGKKTSKESETLVVTDKLMPFVLSVLDVLNFKLVADNFRTRYVYIKDDIMFEIDDYISPKMKVVAIEGEKNKVEKLCNNELKPIIDEFKINSI